MIDRYLQGGENEAPPMPEELREYKIDRTGWEPGPWDNEPDRIEWRSPDGVACLMVRNRFGNWCGYAAVPPGHPWYEKDHDEVEAHAHGGLTYASFCQTDGGPICHIAQPGEPERVWWLGFDCGHAFDYSPGLRANTTRAARALGPRLTLESFRDEPYNHVKALTANPLEMRDIYRDATYVREEVEGLARQIVEASQT